MSKVVIDMTMSLDGFVAGPDDGKAFPLGKNDGMRIFDWYFSGTGIYRNKLFRPEPGANLDQVKLMYEESGAFIFGRRTYDITNGWGGTHPVDGVPVFVLTHTPPPADTVPKGPSNLTFVTDGIASAIRRLARWPRQGHQAWRRIAWAAGAEGRPVRRDSDPPRAPPPRRRRAAVRSCRWPSAAGKNRHDRWTTRHARQIPGREGIITPST
jgi:dihydrofolate reductase